MNAFHFVPFHLQAITYYATEFHAATLLFVNLLRYSANKQTDRQMEFNSLAGVVYEMQSFKVAICNHQADSPVFAWPDV